MLNNDAIVENSLFWIACTDVEEADYLLAVINSDALYEELEPLMPKGQFGARHVHKHLWKLPIPKYDPSNTLHKAIAQAGSKATTTAQDKLKELRDLHGERLTVDLARRQIRASLRDSREGKEIETAVQRMLKSMILVSLSEEQVVRAKSTNGARLRITHAVLCLPHGQVFGTETQCLRYYERWAKRFPMLFLRSYKTANRAISDYHSTVDLAAKLVKASREQP